MSRITSPLGKAVPRVDAYDKVTGRAMFTADLVPPEALVAKVLHAKFANGEVIRMDCSRAREIPGVVEIATCFDVPDLPFATPGNPWTLEPERRDVADRKLLNARVRYYGDEIAAVVAVDEQTARQALEAIEVEYVTYPAAFTPEQALQPHQIPIHAEYPDNVLGETRMEHGDFEQVISEPGLICVDKWYRVPPVKHCQLELPVSYAYQEQGKLVVVSSTQMPHVLRRIIGQALGIPWGTVRVIKPCIGGGFGNKDDALYEPLNAYLCLRVGGRCVRLEMTREEDFVNSRVRHGMSFHLVSYVRSDGSLAARSLETISNQGAYASHGQGIAAKGLLDFSMIYHSDAWRARARTVYTNTPCAGAMRGYGIPQVTFALESHGDDVAAAIGMDPVAFRKKNMMRPGDCSEDGVLHNYYDSLGQCLERASAYLRRKKENSDRIDMPHLKRGTGCAIFWYKTGVWPICQETVNCRMLLNQDGTFLVHLAECEIGQGADTVFTQMVADRLDVPMQWVHVVSEKDTDHTPFGTGAYASRQTYVCGMAIAQTAEKMCRKILERAAQMTGLSEQELSFCGGNIYRTGSVKPLLTLEQLAMDSFYNMQTPEHLVVEHTANCQSNALSLGCCMAEVEVDEVLGTVRVVEIVNVHDCGTVLHPGLARGQVHGGMSMGLGYGLSEQIMLWPDGSVCNGNLLDYKLLTAMDHPAELGAEFVENPEPTSPFGTKALGEPPVVPVAPAIRNALLQATGVALDELPLQPQRCSRAIRQCARQGEKRR